MNVFRLGTGGSIMSIWDAVYYTFFFTGLLYLVSLIVSVHKPMWLLYCLQDLLLGLYFAALDGDLHRWLQLPAELQETVELASAVALLVFGFLAQAYLIAPNHELARFKAPLRMLAVITLVTLPLGLLLDAWWSQPLAVLLAVLGLLSMLLPPLTWGFLPQTAKQIAMPTIVLIALVVVIILLLGIGLFDLTAAQTQALRRVLMVWSVVAGVITMAYMTRNIEHTRRREARRALQAVQKEADLANSLFQAELEYSRVRDLASERSAQLQGVGHDLQQPLFSLRATLGLLADNQNQALTTQMRDALEYADQLANTYLSTEAAEKAEEAGQGTSASETVEISVFLETIQRMYQSQASAAGVELRICLSSCRIHTRPTTVMRILTNLVSNALQHSECSKLLLGVRRHGNGVTLELYDNGIGIDIGSAEQAVASATESAWVNYGLGLGIVAQLCRSAGFTWEPLGVAGKGSRMRIGVPANLVSYTPSS